MSKYIDAENLDCMENDKLVRMSDVIETVENQCSDGNMWGNENLTLIDARKIIDELSDIPAVDAIPVVRCKNCKHYELDSWAKVNGIPLIVAHNICKRWGDGCKTDENGFCFIGEKVME